MPDTQVVSLCNQLIAAQAEYLASDYTDAALDPIDARMTADFDRLTHLVTRPVATLDGARAMAKAAVALATRNRRDNVVCGNKRAEFLALAVAEYLAA